MAIHHLSLDLLQSSAVSNSVLGGQWSHYAPLRLTDSGPLEFGIEAMHGQYMDLASTYLDIQCMVVKTNGDSMGAGVDDVKA